MNSNGVGNGPNGTRTPLTNGVPAPSATLNLVGSSDDEDEYDSPHSSATPSERRNFAANNRLAGSDFQDDGSSVTQNDEEIPDYSIGSESNQTTLANGDYGYGGTVGGPVQAPSSIGGTMTNGNDVNGIGGEQFAQTQAPGSMRGALTNGYGARRAVRSPSPPYVPRLSMGLAHANTIGTAQPYSMQAHLDPSDPVYQRLESLLRLDGRREDDIRFIMDRYDESR